MDFISERTIGGVSVILLKEILSSVDTSKLELMLEAGALKVFTINPAGHIEPGTDAAAEVVLYNQHFDLSEGQWRKLFDWPESLQTVPFSEGMGYNGLFILTSEAERLLLHVDAEPSHDNIEASLKADFDRLWDAIKPGNRKAQTLKKALAFLEKNPENLISPSDFSADTFRAAAKPKRDVSQKILTSALKRLSIS